MSLSKLHLSQMLLVAVSNITKLLTWFWLDSDHSLWHNSESSFQLVCFLAQSRLFISYQFNYIPLVPQCPLCCKVKIYNNTVKTLNSGKWRNSLLTGRNLRQTQAQRGSHLPWLVGGKGREMGQKTGRVVHKHMENEKIWVKKKCSASWEASSI